MKIAIIPARGGSKGIEKKNLQKVRGMTLVEHALTEAVSAKVFDKIFLSTEDGEIAQQGQSFEEVIIIRRPNSLAKDNTLISEVLLDHVNLLELSDSDQVWMIQPTALFRSKADFTRVQDLLIGLPLSSQYGFSVRSVADTHPARMYSRVKQKFKPLHLELQHLRRQDLPSLYLRDGLFYFSSVRALKKNKGTFFGSNPLCVDLKKNYYVNIDTPEDLSYARFLVYEGLV